MMKEFYTKPMQDRVYEPIDLMEMKLYLGLLFIDSMQDPT